MKWSELLRIILRDGWLIVSQSGSHLKLRHESKSEIIIFPIHGSKEMGKGLEKKILKEVGIKLN
jgi:mRNA interferase HicA